MITQYNWQNNKIQMAWLTGWQVIWQHLNEARRIALLIWQENI